MTTPKFNAAEFRTFWSDFAEKAGRPISDVERQEMRDASNLQAEVNRESLIRSAQRDADEEPHRR